MKNVLRADVKLNKMDACYITLHDLINEKCINSILT
jgi:hypothetical protein